MALGTIPRGRYATLGCDVSPRWGGMLPGNLRSRRGLVERFASQHDRKRCRRFGSQIRRSSPPRQSVLPRASSRSSASVATATAMRMIGAPGQKCAPLPNARCPTASRRTSSRPGSGNWAGSWFADESIRMTRSPWATLARPIEISARAPEYRTGRAGVTQKFFDRLGHQFGLHSQSVGLIRTLKQRKPRVGEKARQRLRKCNVSLHIGGSSRTWKATRQLRDRGKCPRRKCGIRRMGSRQEHFSSEPVESFRVRRRSTSRQDREHGRPGPGERLHQVHRYSRGQTLGHDAGGRLDVGTPGGQPCRRQRVSGRFAHHDVRRISGGARAGTDNRGSRSAADTSA